MTSRRHLRWRTPSAVLLLVLAIVASGCATSSSAPTPSSSAAAGTAGAGTAVAARLTPTGATAPIDAGAWALADRLTAANYTADTTSAIVAALARAGIATYADSSSLSPEVPVTAAASPLALLDFQAHALAVGVWTGASWSGSELDGLLPVPAGSTDAAPASVLLASYVAAVDSPGAALSRAVLAGQDLRNPPTVRFPALVLFLFASDLATGGGQVGAPAASPGSPAPSASAAALEGSGELADVARPADGVERILLADPAGGICSDAANWIHTTISRLFEALKLAEPSNIIGRIFVTIWNFAVDVLHSFVEGLITTVTDAVLGSIRSIAATISGVAEQIASLLPYGVHVAVTGGDTGPDFNLGSSARPGSYVATITAADLPDWPAVLKDCAAVAKIQIPDFSSKSIPITWGPVTTAGGSAALLAGDDPTKGNDTTDATGMATWAFTVAPDPGQKTGEDVTQADEMPVAAHRPELTQLRNALTNALLGFVPSLLRGFVQKELLNPTLEKVQGSLNEILDARGYTDAFLHYHEQASPKPSGATASASAGTAEETGPTTTRATDPCALLTAAEAQAALGLPIAKSERYADNGIATVCQYTSADSDHWVAISLWDNSGDRDQFDSTGKSSDENVPVAGVGSDAYFNAGTETLSVWQNGTAFSIQVAEHGDGTSAQTQAAATNLALAALGRL
jgi:hypothetical protein